MQVTRENILKAMADLKHGSPCTWQIRMKMGLKDSTPVRKELLKMERDGIVKRGFFSTQNSICWELVAP